MLFCVSTRPPPPPFRGEEQADSVLRLSEAPAATQELGKRVRKTAADVVAKPQSAASTDAAHRVREASASLGGAAEACVELAARCALYLGCIKAELLRVEEYSHPDGCNGSAHNASVHEEPFRSLGPGDLYFRTPLCARRQTALRTTGCLPHQMARGRPQAAMVRCLFTLCRHLLSVAPDSAP